MVEFGHSTLGEARALPSSFRPAEEPRKPKPSHGPNALASSKTGISTERVLFWLFIAGLAWVPYLWGSNVMLAWGVNALLFPGLAIAYEVSILIRNKGHAVGLHEVWLPAALFASVVLWIFIQNATWTPASWHNPIWAMTAHALNQPVAGSISVDRDLTTQALIRLLTSASVFWLSLQLCRDLRRAEGLLLALSGIVCAYAVYGIIAFSMQGYQSITFFGPTAVRGFVNSTFYNHDHFATYAGIGLVSVCGLILKYYREQIVLVGGYIRHRIGAAIEATAKTGAILDGAAFIILAALLMTGSRGGALASLFGLAALFVLWFGKRIHSSKALPSQRGSVHLSLTAIAGLVFVSVAVFFALMFGDQLFGKFAGEGFKDSNRIAVYVITIRSILTAPFFGFGYGTFQDVFPMFRDRSLPTQGIWLQAHNTYLEVFQGLGLIFGTALIACVVLLVWKAGRGAITRQKGAVVSCVATSVALLIGANSMVDFGLQLQAITLTFMAVLGAGVAQSMSSRVETTD